MRCLTATSVTTLWSRQSMFLQCISYSCDAHILTLYNQAYSTHHSTLNGPSFQAKFQHHPWTHMVHAQIKVTKWFNFTVYKSIQLLNTWKVGQYNQSVPSEDII